MRSRKRKTTKPDRSKVSERHGRAAKGKGQEWQSQEVVKDYRGNNGSYWTEVGFPGIMELEVLIFMMRSVVGSNSGNIGGNKVSFYVTNFPGFMPLFRLCQFFEVFGMLSDMYVARYRNARVQFFGFVRFVNYRDKLAQALNNVWLGDCRVWAHEARCDRFAQFDVEPRDSFSGVRVEEVAGKGKKVVRKKKIYSEGAQEGGGEES